MRSRWRKVFIPLFLAGSGWAQAAFIVPMTGPVPFQRANLPLDKDRLHEACMALTDLGKVDAAADPAVLRRAAQALALAFALDPEQKDAADIMKKLMASESPGVPDAPYQQAGRSFLESIHSWLLQSKAGPDATALANCLADVLADPASTPEQGAWKNWVADLADFQPPPKKENPDLVVPTQPPTTTPTVVPQPKVHQDEETVVKLAPIQMQFILARSNDQFEMKFFRSSLLLTKTKDAAETGIKNFTPLPKTGLLQTMQNAGLKVPKDYQLFLVQLGGPTNGSMPYDLEDLSGASLVMINAASKGVALAATVMVKVAPDGSLKVPSSLWEILRNPDQIPKGRLILPKSAADYLLSTLALTDASFFLQHEVVLVSNIDELCKASSSEPSPEWQSAFDQFTEIQRAGEKMPLGPFLSHPATIQRLRKLIEGCPQHASAQLLLLQATNSRPRYLQRDVLISVVARVAAYLQHAIPAEPDESSSQAMTAAHEMLRKALDPLAPSINPDDQEIFKNCIDLVNEIRVLSRLIAANNRDVYGYGNNAVKATQTAQQIRAEAKKILLGSVEPSKRASTQGE